MLVDASHIIDSQARVENDSFVLVVSDKMNNNRKLEEF